jgi:UDP-N-acetylmuramate dehydrogenase
MKQNISLQKFNSFGIEASTSYYLPIHNSEDILSFLKSDLFMNLPAMILGGGSNVLFTGDFKGVVLHAQMKGIRVLSHTDDHCMLEVAAGESWDEFVNYCVERDLHGIENLSLIPGSVGASPIQNIGAYGAEVSDVIAKVNGIDLSDGSTKKFDTSECMFGYRDSIFKRELKNRFFITSVIFNLSKKASFRLDYGNLNEEVKSLGNITLKNVRQAVINIRNSKLPDPLVTGNAGSFFKNPVISADLFENIQKEYPHVPSFPSSPGFVKIPAAWLIERCGWKGKTSGNAGVHDKQALIIVNKGNATGREIFDLSEKILKSVQKAFGIILEREVNVI